MGKRGTLLYCWWKCKLVQTLWITVWRFLKRVKIELLYDSAIRLPGIYSENTMVQKKDTCTPVFTGPQFIPKCPSTKEWLKKCGTYINGILLSH